MRGSDERSIALLMKLTNYLVFKNDSSETTVVLQKLLDERSAAPQTGKVQWSLP